MSALTDYYERQHDALRRMPLGDVAAERERVRAAHAAQQADRERVQRLADSRPDWQKRAGIVDVAALREQEQQEWAQQAQRSLRATRPDRWRAWLGEHPGGSFDAWGEPKNYTEDVIPEWFE
ncbi:MAG TPA: hypothetical protein VGS80_05690 [Ktedonobacterales bacterium]|nr:hypothetical protein [Ktedonobacterales bacterium]